MRSKEYGHFHWNGLMTRNREAAKAFYAETLGWTYGAFPMADGGHYAVCTVNGQPLGGMLEIKPGTGLDHVPDCWFAYIAVGDIDARLAKVAAAGGAIGRPAFDVPRVGRIAVVQDKAGSRIGWITPAGEG